MVFFPHPRCLGSLGSRRQQQNGPTTSCPARWLGFPHHRGAAVCEESILFVSARLCTSPSPSLAFLRTQDAVESLTWPCLLKVRTGKAFYVETKEDGRRCIVEVGPTGVRDVLPPEYSARNSVYEYGGSAFDA